MAPQDFLVLTFENCSKKHGWLNPLFMKEIEKRPSKVPLKIKCFFLM
jgi:hypothetical protein